MATMVNRKVWWIGPTSIKSGVVLKQNFNPDYLEVRAEGSNDTEIRSSRWGVFLTPREAINEAYERADLLEDSARSMEAALDEEGWPQ